MINSAVTAAYSDVNAAINGGGANPLTGQPFSKLAHGDTCKIPAGTPAAWPSPITVDRNISVIGAGQNQTVITGGAFWVITPTYLDSHLMRISGMHCIRNTAGPTMIQVTGTCPIDEVHITDPTLSGGFRMDHITLSSTTSGTGSGRTLGFAGWIEGVVDHCVWDFDIAPGTLSTGEHIIFNHNGTPDGSPGGNSEYSWSTTHTLNGWQQIFVENCIIKRRGGMDCNQDAQGQAGGARYTARHCTSFAAMGSGHESRSDGQILMVGGLRASACYKNLFVRDSADSSSQGLPLTDIRSGENVTWGNRYNRFGGAAGVVSHPIVFNNYNFSCWNSGTWNGGPDGANHWDDNASGNLALNGSNQPAESTDSFGSIYAHGTGFSRSSTSLYTVNSNGVLGNMPVNKWKGFIIRNLSATRNIPNPVSYGVIASNDATTFTIAGSNQPNSAYTNAQKQFNIIAANNWEIRRVNTYFVTVGAGKMDTPIRPGSSGAFGTATEPTLTDGTRRWTNQEAPGISQWDNAYRTSAGAGFTGIQNWGGSLIYLHAPRNVRNNVQGTNPHPGFTYNPSTAAGSTAGTLVGADDEAWLNAPSTIIASLQATEGDSIDTDGTGGPTYPHPLIGSVPRINETGNTFSTNGGVQSFQLTTSNFSGTPLFSKTITAVPSGATAGQLPTGISFSSGGLFSGNPVGAIGGTYQMTITATSGSQSAGETYNLTILADTAPTVRFQSPTAGQNFTAPASIVLSATASDDVGIASVSFFNGASLINSPVTTSPYTTTWTGVAVGTYSLTAKATDTIGQITQSSPAVNVTVNAPTGTLIAPTIVVTA